MKKLVERNKEYLKELNKQLSENYGFIINQINPASRGMDGETWIVTTSTDKFFIKINYSGVNNKNFIKSLNAIELLNKKNVGNINEIIKTKNNKNYIKFKNKILVVFKYIDGKIDYNYPYLKLMKLLVNIYKVNVKFGIPRENFRINKLLKRLNNNLLKAQKFYELNNVLSNYQINIQKYVKELKKYYKKIDKKSLKVVTHGDDCVNIMVGNDVSLVDWDGILLAPIERDCWFFMDYKYKIKNINNLLKNNNINYRISRNMLAYYAYKSIIIYLNNDIEKYLKLKNQESLNDIEDIFEGWVFKKINSLNKR